MSELGATLMPPRLAPDDLATLAEAVRLLESTSFVTRLTRLFGGQVRLIGSALPGAAQKAVALATDAALKTGLRVALRSLRHGAVAKARERWHRAAATAAGAVGGAFGISALAVELPLSTLILLRSIAEIAQENGEDLRETEAALACLDVLGLGADRAEGAHERRSRYYVARDELARGLADVDFLFVKQGVATELAPMLTRYLTQIAARFGVVVTEKLLAQALPVVGAVGGAAVNAAFAKHFQMIARGHFLVRRLERSYGREPVRFEYERLRGELEVR